MDIKNKRLIVVGICLIWGVLIPFSSFFMPEDFFNWKKYEYDNMSLVKRVYVKTVYCTTSFTSKISYYCFNSYNEIRLWIIQTLIYLVIGIVVSYAAYPPWRYRKSVADKSQ